MQRVLIFVTLCISLTHSTKMYSGQRIFTDLRMIDLTDPAKHGFHIILDQHFVDTHLQPTKLPTVFASAIPLKRPHFRESHSNQTVHPRIGTKPSGSSKSSALGRVNKILYPESGEPDNGLLDGHTIKLLGLQERSWYYVCVEFESNMNRHEMATGLTCQLKRTLDKFGKPAESTVSEIEVLESTDRSITIQLVTEVDFPMSLTVFPDQSGTNSGNTVVKSIPAQTFIVDRSRTLNIVFGPYLDPDTSYGRLCILEEPVLAPSDVYTAMGRAVRATMEHCYMELKTKPTQPKAEPREYQEHFHMAEEPSQSKTSDSTQCTARYLLIVLAIMILYIFSF